MTVSQNIPPCDEDYRTVAETAELLHIGKRNLRDGVNQGRYPHHRHGQQLLFCTADRLVIARLHHHAVKTLMPAPRKPRARRPVSIA